MDYTIVLRPVLFLSSLLVQLCSVFVRIVDLDVFRFSYNG